MHNNWHNNTPFPQTDASGDEQIWRSLAEKTLNGADFDDVLISHTLDAIPIQPLYQQQASSLSSDAATAWRIRQRFTSGSIANVNSQILAELEGGVSAIELALGHKQATYCLPCQTLEDLDLLLAGVHPMMIHTSLQPAGNSLAEAAMLDSLWRKHDIDRQHISAAFNADPLGSLAKTGHLASADYTPAIIELASHTRAHYANATSLCIDTSVYHNAGASEAQELGFALATGVEYLRALTSTTANASDACTQLNFRFALDSDFFLSAAKLRAARLLWNQVLDHCGVSTDSATMMLEAESGLRCLTVHDSSVNILRVTTQAFAALVGGANSFNSTAFDILNEKQTSLGRRIARNTQLILTEESQLQQVHDPLAGSGFIESMTEELAAKAWAIFQQIEAQGSMLDALKSNLIHDMIARSRTLRVQSISDGRTAIIGVSDYPDLESLSCEAERDSNDDAYVPPSSEHSQNNSGYAVPVQTTVTKLCSAIDNGTPLSDLYNDNQNPLHTTPLPFFRDAAVFENMLARTNSYNGTYKRRPTAVLVTLGSAIDYAARTTYCRNFLAVAGINTRIISIEQLSECTQQDLSLVVLCSSNKVYATQAERAIDTLQAASVSNIWLAGLVGSLEQSLIGRGLSEQIHVNCDRVSLLNKALTALEVD